MTLYSACLCVGRPFASATHSMMRTGLSRRPLTSLMRRNDLFHLPKSNARMQLRMQSKRSSADIAEGVPERGRRIVGSWLFGCAGMCFGAVVLGGVTRLTESGLSMVNWDLIKDMRPPKDEQSWVDEFEKYKQFPEYKHILSSGREMTLRDFKFIYYMEFVHRLWGRATGAVFALPAGYFLYKGWISRAMKPRLGVYAALLGFQGFMGWYMVKSGLQEKSGVNDVPRVSQYRLAAHLSTAVILYSLFVWSGMAHLSTKLMAAAPNLGNLRRLQKASHSVTGLIFLTIVSGAFVAGLDAGLVYNTWPKMADRWIPSDILAYKPTWTNFFDNPTTVQFDHRILGKLTVAASAAVWWMCRSAPLPPQVKVAANCVFAMSLIQMTLGISTLLTQVHTHVAATHQAGALTLLTFSLWLMFLLKRIPK